MKLEATSSGNSDFEPYAPNTYVAVCCSIIDLGTKTNIFPNKKTGEYDDIHKVMIVWETPIRS
jgi:hypothetical protein